MTGAISPFRHASGGALNFPDRRGCGPRLGCGAAWVRKPSEGGRPVVPAPAPWPRRRFGGRRLRPWMTTSWTARTGPCRLDRLDVDGRTLGVALPRRRPSEPQCAPRRGPGAFGRLRLRPGRRPRRCGPRGGYRRGAGSGRRPGAGSQLRGCRTSSRCIRVTAGTGPAGTWAFPGTCSSARASDTRTRAPGHGTRAGPLRPVVGHAAPRILLVAGAEQGRPACDAVAGAAARPRVAARPVSARGHVPAAAGTMVSMPVQMVVARAAVSRVPDGPSPVPDRGIPEHGAVSEPPEGVVADGWPARKAEEPPPARIGVPPAEARVAHNEVAIAPEPGVVPEGVPAVVGAPAAVVAVSPPASVAGMARPGKGPVPGRTEREQVARGIHAGQSHRDAALVGRPSMRGRSDSDRRVGEFLGGPGRRNGQQPRGEQESLQILHVATSVYQRFTDTAMHRSCQASPKCQAIGMSQDMGERNPESPGSCPRWVTGGTPYADGPSLRRNGHRRARTTGRPDPRPRPRHRADPSPVPRYLPLANLAIRVNLDCTDAAPMYPCTTMPRAARFRTPSPPGRPPLQAGNRAKVRSSRHQGPSRAWGVRGTAQLGRCSSGKVLLS